MICISIAQKSHKLALVDMHNAARQCDLLEVRFDRFEKAPDIGLLLANNPRPVIMSCRRPQDGGEWQGSEEERFALLRQCVVSRADYVEIELDAAEEIRQFPPAKRVISYTNLEQTPADIADIYADACAQKADVVKLVTTARTPEEAWPLVQIVAKATVPTVVVGVGKPGVMLTILGKRVGAPWTYAALERGMETYPGQPTVRDLEEVYHYRAVDKGTRFVGVTGFDEVQRASVAVLNSAFAQLGLSARCLPVQVGSLPVFRKLMAVPWLAAVVADQASRGAFYELAAQREPFAQQTQAVDLLLHTDPAWHGFDTLGRAAVSAVEAVLRARTPADRPLEGRTVVVAGINPTAKSLGYAIKHRGGILVLASRNREGATRLALEVGGRVILLDALYGTAHDVLIVCDDEKVASAKSGAAEPALHPGVLRPGAAVLDLTTLPFRSPLLREAALRGCLPVAPRDVLVEQLQLQVRLITGKQVPVEKLGEVLTATLPEEE